MRVPTRVPTTDQLRRHEATWIEKCHRNWGMVLMELAGKQVAEKILPLWDENKGPVAIVCGPGNNGGDGFVAARYLALWQVPVRVFEVRTKPRENGSKADDEKIVHRQILESMGLSITTCIGEEVEELRENLDKASIVVDALFGTGLDRPLAGPFARAVDIINKSGKIVCAVDLPSGVNSDTGQIMGVAVQANMSVTLGYLKAGLLNHPGADLTGRLTVADIGLPELDLHNNNQHSCWELITRSAVAGFLPKRPDDAHKGTFGHVLTVAGSAGMSGASLLSSKSALRVGAGLCILATGKSLVPSLPPQEVIYRGLTETAGGSISPEATSELIADMEKFSAVILGPGLSLNDKTVEFVHSFLPLLKKPCLIDADALNAISLKPTMLDHSRKPWVMTPHPRELSRLLSISLSDIQGDRITAAQKAATRFGCVIVLKGARSIVASPDNQVAINPTGNPGMATAGAGDVLSGAIGGLMAQGMDPYLAALCGTYIHGAAGDLAAAALGDAGTTAGDIMHYLPQAIDKIKHEGYLSALEQQLFEG